MKLISKNQIKNTGFTLIEVLVVLGVLAILIIVPISVWRNNKNRITFNEAKEEILLALEKARSRATTGFGSGDHSVNRAADNKIVIHEEGCSANCDDVNIYLPASVLNISDFPVVFKRISTEATAKDINISFGGKSAVISVKSDGTIVEN